MKFVAGLLSFTMTFTSAFSLAAGPQCTDVNLQQYMKAGDVEDKAPDKIYRFADMRADIIKSISDPHKTKCLNDAYQSGLEQEAQYWGKRLADANCPVDADGEVGDDCPIADEVRESNEYLENLENDSNEHIRRAVQISRQLDAEERQTAATPTSAPSCSAVAKPVELTRLQLHEISCCGSPSDKGGAVRINEPNISYRECLGKIGENTHSVADSVITCAGSIVKGAVSAIWEAIKGLWHLPAMIGQVWSLMTNASARNAFFNKIMDYVKAKKQSVFSCYNGHEIAQEACRDVGSIIAMCAAPESASALIGVLAKPLSALARAKAIEGVLAATSKGKALVGKLGRGQAAADRAVGAARTAARAGKTAVATAKNTAARARALASRAPRIVKAPAKWTGRRLEDLNRYRRTIGRPLSSRAERAALAAARSGTYKRLLQRAVRAEEQARRRAQAAGGLALRVESRLPRSAALVEASTTGVTRGAAIREAANDNAVAPTAARTDSIRVDYNAPMPTTPLGKGARLGTTPEGSIRYQRTYTPDANPLANRPPLGKGAPLGTVPEGGISFKTTITGKPAPPEPNVNLNVRFNGGEARAVPRTEPRVQSANPETRAAVDDVVSDIRRISTPERPRNAAEPVSAEPVVTRDAAKALHERVAKLKDEKSISIEDAGRLHEEINARFEAATGRRLAGTKEARRAEAERAHGDAAAKNTDGGKTAAVNDNAPNAATDAAGAESNAAASNVQPNSAPRVIVRRVIRTERELTDSRDYLDRFSAKVEKLSTEPSVRERKALFQASRSDKVHAEADRMHTQVDDLIAANRITTNQASSYHQTIARAESFATSSPTVREWKAPQAAEAPISVTPVKRLVSEEPSAPVDVPEAPVESPDVVLPPAEAAPVSAPAPSAAAPVSAKPVSTSTQPVAAPQAPVAGGVPLKLNERIIATKYQAALDEVAPPMGPRVSSAISYYDRGVNRTWMATGKLPDQGWKLHVSATPAKAEKIAKLLLPELRRLKIGHQIAKDMNEYMLRGAADPQFGKFITIFPKSTEEARKVAEIAERVMKKAGLREGDFPTPQGEQLAGVGVFARYGRFTGGPLHGANGEVIPNSIGMLQTPDGRLVPDMSAQPAVFAGQLIPRKPGVIQRVRDRFRRDDGARTPSAPPPQYDDIH